MPQNSTHFAHPRSGSASPARSLRTRPTHIDESPQIRANFATRIPVYVVAENQLLCEALARTLSSQDDIRIAGLGTAVPVDPAALLKLGAEVLLLVARENVQDDRARIQILHLGAPAMRILLLGSARQDGEFLQYVRAGISGYLRSDASASDLLDGIQAVHSGRAICPGELCAALFRYFEHVEPALPCGSPVHRLGLTRREQQLVPLIAKGLSNKEIANHFCLSEQTVKNHLYRIKHKIGGEDRLSIVHRFRTQGFLL